MSTRTGPFGDNILACLIVRRKSKSNTRKGGAKVNPHDQLSLATIGTLDLDGWIAHVLWLGHAWGHGRRGQGLLYPISRRRTDMLHPRLGILQIGIERRRMRSQLLGWRQRTGGTAVRVTRGPSQSVLLRLLGVHGKTGGRRAGMGGRRTRRGRTVGSRSHKGVRRRIGDLRSLYAGGWGGVFGVVVTAIAFPEAEGFPPGTHQVHKSGMKRTRIEQRATREKLKPGGVRKETHRKIRGRKSGAERVPGRGELIGSQTAGRQQ